MNLSAPFIQRPVATALLTLALVLLGGLSFGLLPVAPLPKLDFPAVTVTAQLPGASPEVMAATVATPLERALGNISGISQMTSSSRQGTTQIILLFNLRRNVNDAAREVQAAINKARPLLPTDMVNLPTYRKINPAQSPIMVLAMTSPVLPKARLYDIASTVVAQKISQVSGVGQVRVLGGALSAVRVSLQPGQLDHYGLALDQVRQAIASANAQRPKGDLEQGSQRWQVQANDQLTRASQYAGLVMRAEDGAILHLRDVAMVRDADEDRYNKGFYNNRDAVLLLVNRQADANIIATIDGIKRKLPGLRAEMPTNVDLDLAVDRSTTIRSTLYDAEHTLLAATALVILVVLMFLGHWRAALIPALAVPVSLIGTFVVMYAYDFSLNNLSLMALILATGLVVDDAIVVLENIARHMENGLPPMQAALQGTREVGFTLLSMNLSMVAVFSSTLFVGGFAAELFREFSITLTAAVVVSLVTSLTLTPMLCSRYLLKLEQARTGRFHHYSEAFQKWLLAGYARGLDWSLRHAKLMLAGLLATIAFNVYLYVTVPKTFLPTQDTGLLQAFVRGDSGISFNSMAHNIDAYRDAFLADPAVASVVGASGGSLGTSSALLLISLKPLEQRHLNADQVLQRLRRKMPTIPGVRIFMMATQDLLFSGRQDRSSDNEYVLLAEDLADLRTWQPKVRDALRALPELTEINANEGKGTQQLTLVVDRQAAKRLGIDIQTVMEVFNNAFSQRQISTIYGGMNQYQVVLEVEPRFAKGPEALNRLHVITANGEQVPLAAIAHWQRSLAQDKVEHQGQFAAENIGFNLAPGVSLEQATAAVQRAVSHINLPTTVQGLLGGTGNQFMEELKGQPVMILVALVVVYLVLGVLYESYIHPLTILSTLPSAGVGALLAIRLFGQQFSLISLLGIFMLIGIVMKNAILMIDLALELERKEALDPLQSIHRAALLRFRPILMTTLAALLGALPLIWDHAEGAELRQPLGVAIVGGLILSQLLTLYTTPVVYLLLDRLRHRVNRRLGKASTAALDKIL